MQAAQKAPKMPEHQAIYLRLREQLLLGRYAPGDAITIHGLKHALGAGMTPAREAIRRLAAENALEALENRRVIVPRLSAKQLADIYFIRTKVEPELAARAVEFCTSDHIRALQRIDADVDDAIISGDVERYLRSNRDFHFLIYSLAQSPVLFHTVQSLWVQFGPSLRVVCGRFGTSNLPDQHSALLDAFRRSDAGLAGQAILNDIQQGFDLIEQSHD